MANRTFLIRDDTLTVYKDLQASMPLCAASYMVPIFWYSLFDQADAITKTTPSEDGQYAYTAFCRDAQSALSLSKKRSIVFSKTFGPQVQEWYDTWHNYVAQQRGSTIYIETCELVWMFKEPEEYKEQANEHLAAFSSEPFEKAGLLFKKIRMEKNWAGLLVQADIKDYKKDIEDYKFCGYSWERPVPWE